MRWLLILGGILAVFAVLALLVAGWAWWAVKSVPAEYERVLVIPAETRQVAIKQLETKAVELSNEIKRPNRWQAVFTEQELNSWLADELPKHDQTRELPPEVKEPRIVLGPGRVQLFARYSGQIETVVSLDVEVGLTAEPNQLAFKVRSARAGALPLPLDEATQQVTRAAGQAEVPLRWAEENGMPVAIVTLPPDHWWVKEKVKHEVFLEQLEIRAGEIVLHGRTGKRLP